MRGYTYKQYTCWPDRLMITLQVFWRAQNLKQSRLSPRKVIRLDFAHVATIFVLLYFHAISRSISSVFIQSFKLPKFKNEQRLFASSPRWTRCTIRVCQFGRRCVSFRPIFSFIPVSNNYTICFRNISMNGGHTV